MAASRTRGLGASATAFSTWILHAMRRGKALAIICGALSLWAAGALAADGPTKRVVLLFAERPGLPNWAAAAAGFKNTLTANFSDRLEIYHEAMDLSRFGTQAYRVQLRGFLHAKYADTKIDVAVAVMGPALDFLLEHGEAIFPGVPIVFCGVDRREIVDRSLPPRVSGVFVKRKFSPTVGIALALHPDTRRIVVVAGSSEVDTRVLQDARQEFRAYEDRVAFAYLTGLPLRLLLKEVSKLPPRTIVLFTTFLQDGAGESFASHDVVERLSAAANAPIYGFIDQNLGSGIVGGSLYSPAQQGPEAAKLTMRILNGTTGSRASRSAPELNQVLFDWRQLQRWGIGENRLPAGSEIRFRPLSVWEQHRAFVLTVGAILALLAVVLVALLLQIARRRKAELSLRQSEERLAFSAASTHTGLWQYEVPTHHLWTTEQSRAMFGLNPKSQPSPEAFFRVVHPDDRQIVAAGLRLVLSGPAEPKSTEFRVRGSDGRIRWILATSKMHLDSECKPCRISGVFKDITARKAAEREAEQLSERLSTIQDEEREQIALDLHDSTAQYLAAACLNMMSVQHRLDADQATQELCNEVERNLEEATKELRTHAYLLNPPQLARDGLEVAVRRYVEGFARRTELHIKLRISPRVEDLSLPSQRALLRVVQEALANVHRHAAASQASVTIKCVASRVHLVVSDNGKGMIGPSNGQSCGIPLTGVGIPGMTARLRRLGGDLKIRSGVEGTTLHGVIVDRGSTSAAVQLASSQRQSIPAIVFRHQHRA